MFGLNKSGAKRDQQQPEIERFRRRHRQRVVSKRDRPSANEHSAPRAQDPVGNEPARDRQHINGHGVIAIDAARIGRRECKPAAGNRRDHKQRQQRAHTVVRKALPKLGEKQSR